MPNQNKLVKVNDLGIVAFPATMPDEQVASVIKEFRSKPNDSRIHKASPHFIADVSKTPDAEVEKTVEISKTQPTEIEKKLKEYKGTWPQLPAPEFQNNQNEGTYAMFGGDAKNPQAVQVPFSSIPQAFQKGYIWFNGDEKNRYTNDLKAAKPIGLSRATDYVQRSLASKPGGDPIANTMKAVERAIYVGAPSFVVDLAKSAYTDATGQTQGALVGALDPGQIPAGLYQQYQEDAKVDQRMAQDNLLGSLIGLYATGKIGESAPKLSSNLIGEASVPERFNSRIVHSNPVGEVRMGKDGVPTIWLQPKAWHNYMRAAHPEVLNPHTVLGENVRIDPEFMKLSTMEHPQKYADWAHVRELLKKANDASTQQTAVLARRSGGIGQAVNVLREEKIHSWQRSLSQNRDVMNHLTPQAFSQLASAVPKPMRDHLNSVYGPSSNPVFVSEAAARYIANDLQGTTPADAVQFLSQYFDAVVQQHGPNALSTLERTRGLAKHLQEVIDEEHRGTDRTATQGNVRGVPEGRQAGTPPITGATPEPAFNRQQTKSSEFRNWFGESKVVDEYNQPKIVYHGTYGKDFSEFETGHHPGKSTPISNFGFFFTDNPELAGGFAKKRRGARLIPAYLSIRNPLIEKAAPRSGFSKSEILENFANDDERQDYIDRAKAAGHDGLIFESTDGTEYVAFRPDQIKSAIGNRGTFDSTTGNILFRREPSGNTAEKTVPYLPITPEMRQSLQREGVPMFRRDASAIEAETQEGKSPLDQIRSLKQEAEQRNPSLDPVIGNDRRRNSGLRKRISEMTPEEMRRVLLTSETVDLPNRRSFDEDQMDYPAAAIGRSDADALKAFNDRFGYEKGNALLRAKADALKQVGLQAYHEKGDEFLYRGDSQDEMKEKLEKAREILRNTVFDVTLDDGRRLQLKGVDFSYGTGSDLEEAESNQHTHKSEREARGERKRGELRGITEIETVESEKH